MRILKLIAIVVVSLGYYSVSHAQVAASKELHKVQVAWQIINTMYVDTVNSSKLAETAITSMLQQLDPHSSYVSAQELKALDEPLQGSFDGIGIEFAIIQDSLVVASVIANGPSEKVGLLANDRIISIDEKNIAGIGLKNSDVFKMLRGKRGSRVDLEVVRRGEPKSLVFKIKRDKIPIYSVDASYMVDNKIGYIKISRFGAQTHDEFVKALKSLKSEGMKSLIIDLRGNGGGYLKAAFDIADELIDNKKMIVYTKGNASPLMEFKASSKGLFEKGPLVILIDEGSASASEIVAGAIQDWDRGVIIGRRSFGKGLVQRPIKLPDESEIRLTTAKYYTPSGRCIQKSYENGASQYKNEILHRLETGELVNSDSIPVNDDHIYRTMLSERVVYGGGGIYPDLFVSLDTTRMSPLMQDIVRRGLVQRFTISIMETMKAQLSEYGNYRAFTKYFAISDDAFSSMINEAKSDNVVCTKEELESEKYLMLQLKAYIARRLYTDSDFYRVVNPETDIFNRGVNLLKTTKEYERLLK